MAMAKRYTHFIAIDFGTAGCGVVTSLSDSEDTHAFSQWNPGRMSIKTPTIMLLDRNQECEAFGLTARNKYYMYMKAKQHKEEFKNYYLFEYFKMSLYEEKVSNRYELVYISVCLWIGPCQCMFTDRTPKD